MLSCLVYSPRFNKIPLEGFGATFPAERVSSLNVLEAFFYGGFRNLDFNYEPDSTASRNWGHVYLALSSLWNNLLPSIEVECLDNHAESSVLR